MNAGLNVVKAQCDQCLFGKNKVVSEARKEDLIRKCVKSDSYFVCHKTEDAVCAGFFARYSTNLIRIMGRMNGINFVKVK